MFKYLLIFFLLIFTSASSEIIKKIEILGNKRISLETIKVYGDISENDNFTKFDSDKVLKSLYSTDFFEDIKLDFNNGILKITVKEYRVINAIYIKGEETKKITKGILERLKLKEKGSFIKNTINEDIELIKNIYASIGHNFTTVDAKIESFSDDRVNLIYSVDKGEKTSISKIYFIGNKKIKDKRLRDLIVSEEDKFWKFLSSNTSLNYNNIELDKRLLKNYYKSAGYYDVQVVSSNAEINKNNETILTYNINAGTRYKVNKITTNVSDVFDKKIFVSLNESYQKIIGKYYSPFKIKKLLAELDNLIADADLC
jgi:outer membrane protein insertion porin family